VERVSILRSCATSTPFFTKIAPECMLTRCDNVLISLPNLKPKITEAENKTLNPGFSKQNNTDVIQIEMIYSKFKGMEHTYKRSRMLPPGPQTVNPK